MDASVARVSRSRTHQPPQNGPELVEPLPESGPHLATIIASHLPGHGPLYRQLATALKLAVDAGEVALGTVLPPERALAAALSVSRSTVVTAYGRLKDEGWLESRQGSGTWVRRPDTAPEPRTSSSRLLLDGEEDDLGVHPLPQPTSDLIEFTVAAVPGAAAVVDAVRDLDRAALEQLTASHGYLPAGIRPLRRAVAQRFAARGVPTSEDQVVVTTGVHQAIALVARETVQPGDSVLVESPTFPGALDVFRSLGARLVPVPVDEHGARTDVLADLVARTTPRLLYVVPTFHNPTGAVMPPERRTELARLAATSRIPVIEDLSLVDTGLTDEEPPPPIAAGDPRAPVFSVGSMSKLFWAGLRIGWVRAQDPAAAARIATAKTIADLGSPMLSQLVATRLLPHTDEVRAQRRAELLPRLETLLSALRTELPDWSWVRPLGGLSLWCQLPYGNAEEFAEVALRHGVAVITGPVLSVDEGNRRALRLVFTLPEDVIVEGVRRLATAWEAYAPAGGARPSSRLLV